MEDEPSKRIIALPSWNCTSWQILCLVWAKSTSIYDIIVFLKHAFIENQEFQHAQLWRHIYLQLQHERHNLIISLCVCSIIICNRSQITHNYGILNDLNNKTSSILMNNNKIIIHANDWTLTKLKLCIMYELMKG